MDQRVLLGAGEGRAMEQPRRRDDGREGGEALPPAGQAFSVCTKGQVEVVERIPAPCEPAHLRGRGRGGFMLRAVRKLFGLSSPKARSSPTSRPHAPWSGGRHESELALRAADRRRWHRRRGLGRSVGPRASTPGRAGHAAASIGTAISGPAPAGRVRSRRLRPSGRSLQHRSISGPSQPMRRWWPSETPSTADLTQWGYSERQRERHRRRRAPGAAPRPSPSAVQEIRRGLQSPAPRIRDADLPAVGCFHGERDGRLGQVF